MVDPLYEAAAAGDISGIRDLRKSGVDIHAADSDGWTALMYAACFGQIDTVQFLLDSGAKTPERIDQKDNGGSTALGLAAMNEHADVMELLIRHGADAESMDDDGDSILHNMMYHTESDALVQVVRTLIAAGINVDTRDAEGKTSLMWASWEGSEKVVLLLLQAGADPEATDNDGWNAERWGKTRWRGARPDHTDESFSPG